MIRFDRFPKGKTHAVVFSFDDGRSEDVHLSKLLEKYGLKATFHLNSGKLNEERYLSIAQVNQLSKVHEIALHGENHARFINCPSSVIVQEILNDRHFLEEKLGDILYGLSYPYGDVNEIICNSVSACGIKYARTTNSTHRFGIPNDFLIWNPTCHIYEMVEDLPRFLDMLPRLGQAPLFLIWGHSFEIERDKRWEEIEAFFCNISKREDIWYATCDDVYSYMQAVRRIRVSADETIVENPSFRSVWISYNKNPLEIKGGDRIKLK